MLTNLRQVIEFCRRRIYLAVAFMWLAQCVASRNRWEYDWASINLEGVMARTPGAKNRTPRELRAEAKRLQEKARLLERIDKLRKSKKRSR